MSIDGHVVEMILYPACEEHDTNIVAIGIFEHVKENAKPDTESKLKSIMRHGILKKKFTNKFGKIPTFMVIPNDCNCCS
ncbi:putative ORFan [Tupanvirus deep ocean]|uniref:ORFan n=2 Tax=Tupanvirus TaxID=2094720 RepID=A0AC62A7B9_9VIRU|nr:putative ORFan [Tupanvirus deep ocean]QKU33677.1 putative ORFan [Tupanvirus deep ocean]